MQPNFLALKIHGCGLNHLAWYKRLGVPAEQQVLKQGGSYKIQEYRTVLPVAPPPPPQSFLALYIPMIDGLFSLTCPFI